MKRLFPLSLLLAAAAAVYACSSDDGDTPATPDTDAGGGGSDSGNGTPDGSSDTDSGNGGDDAGTDGDVTPTGNPIEGIAAPTSILADDGAFYDGPTWHAKENALYFTLPLDTAPALYRMAAGGGAALAVRTEAAGQGPIGSTVDKNGALVLAEANKVVRIQADGGGAAATLLTEVDAGGTGAAVLTPNDVVARLSDNTLYVTDPGYNLDPPPTNRIYRIAPNGEATTAFDFGADIPRPNGIAITKDEKTVYVSFTAPPAGQVPYIMKYPVNANGTLGNGTKFVDVGADTTPDGLAVDDAGNVYVATKTGVAVFKADGSGKWGDIAIASQPVTGVTFGGADRKTLFITSVGKIYSVAVKVPGLSQ